VLVALLAALTDVPARLRAELAPVTVRVEPASVPLGGTVFVAITAPEATVLCVQTGGKQYPVTRQPDGRWKALVGVWMEELPGPRIMRTYAEVNGKKISVDVHYTVEKRTFPIQRLRMTKEQDAQYEAPSVQEEYRLIRAAINHHDAEQAWQGAFALPVDGRISTRYGVQRYRNGKKVGVHKGIDIAAPTGSPIRAANAGTVTLRRDFGLHGRTIVVNHGSGVVGLYLHLHDFDVAEGDLVKAGQVIGSVGSTGVATGPHLHYALYVHGTAIDPVLWKTIPSGW
jgi:lysostaphin